MDAPNRRRLDWNFGPLRVASVLEKNTPLGKKRMLVRGRNQTFADPVAVQYANGKVWPTANDMGGGEAAAAPAVRDMFTYYKIEY